MTTRHLGIDVGGTNCKLAVLETTGHRPDPPGDHPGGPPDPRLLEATSVPTGAGDPGEVVDRVAAAGPGRRGAPGAVGAGGGGGPRA